MITPPRRAVTRFFVPFIDVLILLFGIFLLMPFVSGPSSPETPDAKSAAPREVLPDSVPELQRQLTEARERLSRSQKIANARVTDRLVVRVLHTDRKDGTLYYFDPNRQEIRTEEDAKRFVLDQETQANKAGGVKDLYFLILYPENPLGFPTRKQEDQIRRWFHKFPHEFQ